MGQALATSPLRSQISSETDLFCKTRVNIRNFTFTWEIENFSHCPQQFDEGLRSSTFSARDSKDKWHLSIYVRGDDPESKDYASLFLFLVESNRTNVGATFVFSLKRDNDKHSYTGDEFQYSFTVNGNGYGSSKFINRSYLLDPKNGLLPDNKLTIVCSMTVTEDIVSAQVPMPVSLGNDSAILSAHQTNQAKLLSSEELSDCTIGVGGKQFNVHRAILSAHSPVFSAMFNHDTKESRTGQIVIQDTEPEVMKEMLQFIYTSAAPNLKSMADRLLVLADKYQVQPLKLLCEEALCEQMSVETSCDILVQADRLSNTRLKSYATQFMIAHVKSVSESEGFKSLAQQYPNLFFEAVQTLASQFKP